VKRPEQVGVRINADQLGGLAEGIKEHRDLVNESLWVLYDVRDRRSQVPKVVAGTVILKAWAN
jgi:hypothetical protein